MSWERVLDLLASIYSLCPNLPASSASSHFNAFTCPMSARSYYSCIPRTGGSHQPRSQVAQTRTMPLRDDSSCPLYRVVDNDGGRDTAMPEGCCREREPGLRTQ